MTEAGGRAAAAVRHGSDASGTRASIPSRFVITLTAVSCALMVAIASGRILVAQPSSLWFDIDPASNPFPFAGVAPSLAMMLDSFSLLLACVAVVSMRAFIDRTGVVMLVAAMLGSGVALAHGFTDSLDAWRGMQWIAAMVGAATITACLRAMPEPRSRATAAVLLGILVAAVAPLAARGVLQVWVEHPAMVAHFDEHRAEILGSHGWEIDSSQAQTYERRLRQVEATGWFGLSNVTSSVLAAATLALIGAAIAIRRVRPGGTVLLGFLSAVCALLVAVNGSKGAIASLMLGSMFAVWCAWRAPSARLRTQVALASVAFVLVAVALRGAVGEASSERSLLFRAQYAQGALRIAADHPFVGVGSDGFADAYLLARPDGSPEEVSSAHAAWADWLASLGVFGCAWIALLLIMLGLAAQTSQRVVPSTSASSLAWTRGPIVAAFLTLVISLLAIVPESVMLEDNLLLLRVLAALFAAVIAAALVRAALFGDAIWRGAVAGSALLLVVHAQIEMTLWWPGAVGWVAAVIAVSAGGSTEVVRSKNRVSEVVTLVCATGALLAAGMGLMWSQQAGAAESAVAAAAEPIAAFGRARLDISPKPAGTLEAARAQAAQLLLSHPGNSWIARPSLVAAALQQLSSSISVQFNTDPSRAALMLELARAQLQSFRYERVASQVALLAESVQSALPASAAVDRRAAQELLRDAAEVQVALNPRSVRGWQRLSRASAALGQTQRAREAAGRGLVADDSFRLDPLRKLPASERLELESRAAEH